MHRRYTIKSKKGSKKTQDKTSSKGKTSLESTRGSELSQSFSDRFESLGVGESGPSQAYNNSNNSEGI